jgi:hypothetical protein
VTLRAEALAVLNAVTDYLDREELTDRVREVRRSIADIRTVYLATTAPTSSIRPGRRAPSPPTSTRPSCPDSHQAAEDCN